MISLRLHGINISSKLLPAREGKFSEPESR